MKNPRFFLLIVFIFSLIFLFLDLPSDFRVGQFSLPSKKIDINIGLVKIKKNFEFKLGLDLQGGSRLTYKVDLKNIKKENRESAFESVRNVIDRRVNFFGVTEPTIQNLKVGDEYRVIVELPGTTNVVEAQNLIGKTAQLSFWEGTDQKPATSSSFLINNLSLILGSSPRMTSLSGKDLTSSSVSFDSNTGKPQVQLNFTPEGANKFASITKKNVGKPIVIVLDQEIVEAPRVNEPILNGNAVISGGFTVPSANNLKIQLNAGALPAPLEIIAQSTIGPSLGINSLKRSIVGGILGFISICIFMIFLYKKEGILACFALIIYILTVLFIFQLIPVTLTLAGFAGFILSIGMAVDANILIFERMKEERRIGKPQSIVVKLGFARAWSSIRDSNISSLITCFILFEFGSGIIRGFAFTLAIGILVSMFSAIMVTRSLILVFDNKEKSVS